MELTEKLKILTDAAKYDVSCSSSGSTRKNKSGIGNAHLSGICHSFSEDGRCISLLKILFTNHCIYNCKYCINKIDSSIKRAAFTVDEVVDLTINFYRRNYIEGLFLSSGIYISPDYTMKKLIEVARKLRFKENFNGYIHMKAIPSCSPDLIEELGNLVDRLSINIELPSERSLMLLAPKKTYEKIFIPMNNIKEFIKKDRENKKLAANNRFVPAGQTTQMIVGASSEDDRTIILKSQLLYKNFQLKRVYYSAYIPINVKNFDFKLHSELKKRLNREHRIYQADFLMRFYKFNAEEILTKENPFFDVELDPKLNYAISNYKNPIEINTANYNELLRIPGIGPTSAQKIIKYRKVFKLRYDDLKKLHISTKRAKNFITVFGEYRGIYFDSISALKNSFIDKKNEQLSFFGGSNDLYI